MSHTIPRESLLRAVRLAASAAPRTSPKACLHGILLEASKDKLRLTGTDMEHTLSIEIPAEGSDRFTALPNAARLLAVLSENTSDEIKLHKEDDELQIRTDFAETVLKDCDDTDAFPKPTPSDPENPSILNAERLSKALKRTVYCCASESARYALTGVKFEPSDGKLTIVATDGKRMAVETIESTGIVGKAGSFVVPEKAIRLLLASCKGDDGDITVGLTNNHGTFTVDGVTIHCRLVEGRYPTYQEVFPKRIDYKIPLNTGTLLRVTRQAAILTDDDSRGIDFKFSNGLLTLHSRVPEKGRAEIKLPVAYDGPDFTVVMAGDLVTQMLSNWGPDVEVEGRFLKNNTVSEWRFPDEHVDIVVPLTRA